MASDREELRRLIDVIERGANTGDLEQAVDDIKTFANAASYLANKLDTRLKSKAVRGKKGKAGVGIGNAAQPSKPVPTANVAPASSASSGMPSARSTTTSQADFERLKPVAPQSAVGPNL